MHGGHMEIGRVHTHQLVQILIREDVWDDRVGDDDYNGFDNVTRTCSVVIVVRMN